MPVSLVAGSGIETTNKTITVQKPAGTQEGDVLIALSSETDNTTYEITAAPAGWTPLSASGATVWAYAGVRSQVWWKRAGASEPASYAWTAASANSYQTVSIVALRGCLPTGNPIEVAAATSGTSAADPGAPGVTVASAAGMRLCLFAADATSNNDLQPVAPLMELEGIGSHARVTSMAGAAYATSGALPAGTATATESGRAPKVAWTLALPAGNTAPNAPILGLPDGTVLDRNSTNRLPWTFSDPDAGDSQSAANLRYRITGTTPWTTVNIPTPNQFWDAVAGTFAAGDYEWQVETADQSGTWGPYCTSGFFTVADAPNPPTWLDPISGQTIGSSSYTGVISAPNVDESEWTLYADNAGAIGTTVLQGPVSVTTGDLRSHTFAGLANNTPVWWSVRIKDNGLWSQPTQIRTPVSYTPPASPTVTLTPDAANGALVVGITNPAPGAGEPATSYNNVYVDDGKGAGKERVATMLATNQPWTYPWPVSLRDYTGNLWVEAVATNGTTAETTA